MKPGDLVRLIDPHTYAGRVPPGPDWIGMVIKVEISRPRRSHIDGTATDRRDVVAEVMWHEHRYHSADRSKLPRYLTGALEVINEAG